MSARAVRDPCEGLAPDGSIRTGVARERVPAAYEPVVAAAVDGLGRPGASLYLYGSVATGRAGPTSDVDLLALGVAADRAAAVAAQLSDRFAPLCRSVEVGVGQPTDFDGPGDEAYGNRVFLRHYCLLLSGPDRRVGWPAYPGDVRAARGFNGDLDRYLARWRATLPGMDPGHGAALGRKVARKTLLALSGLVSVHDATWTTDRGTAVRRWSEVVPALAADLTRLLAWADGQGRADASEVAVVLAADGIVTQIRDAYAARVGMWPIGV